MNYCWPEKCNVCDTKFTTNPSNENLCADCKVIRKIILANNLPEKDSLPQFRMIVEQYECIDPGMFGSGVGTETKGNYPVYKDFCNSMIDLLGNVQTDCKLKYLYLKNDHNYSIMKIVKNKRYIDLGK